MFSEWGGTEACWAWKFSSVEGNVKIREKGEVGCPEPRKESVRVRAAQ